MSCAQSNSRAWKRWLRLGVLAGLAGVLALAFTHFKQPPFPTAVEEPHVEPEPRVLELQHWSDDKVFVDPNGTRIYAPAHGGGVEAISMFTGERLWHVPAASSVAGASKGLLVAWAAVPPVLQRNGSWKQNDLQVVVLNAATGETAFSTPVSLPDWAIAVSHTYGGGHRFRATAQVEVDEIHFHWKSDTWYWGGPPPPPDIEKASAKKAVGSLSINLLSKQVGSANWRLHSDPEPPFESRDSVRVGDLTILLELGAVRNDEFKANRTVQVSRGGAALWRREIATLKVTPDPP